VSWPQLCRWYGRWSTSLLGDASLLSSGVPWITYGAIEHIGRVFQPGGTVFEFGSGGSTLFFAARAGRVTSIEHDPSWAKMVNDALAKHGFSNGQVRWIPPVPILKPPPPDPADAGGYGTADEAFREYCFEAYVRSVDDEPDGSLDLVMIDGRARPSCLLHALPKVKRGGVVVLDNSDRDYYEAAMRLADRLCHRVDHAGPAPRLGEFSRTSVWTKR
jgi:precorrin-6B methylase 2